MTRIEATLKLLGRFEVGSQVIDCDYDPAGSTTSFVPDPSDVRIIEAFAGRALSEDDLLFVVGSTYSRTRYGLRAELLAEIAAKLPEEGK